MDEGFIIKFLSEHNYDVRETKNGRWIDQKCTMDVMCMVSDCISEYISHPENKDFSVKDIWFNQYTIDNVQQIFRKPDPSKKAKREYDKYFGNYIGIWKR